MALNSKNVPSAGRTPADPIDSGTYPGRLVQVIDLGLQPQNPYQGQERPPAYEVMVTYELVDEFMKDEDENDILDKPRWISETFPFHNLAAEKAKSTIRYKVMDPNLVHNGDWTCLLETPVNVTVIQNPGKGKNAGKVYNNVAAISPMRERDAKKCPPLVNPSVAFDLDDPDMEAFNRFPTWIQDKIKTNLEFNGSVLERLLKGEIKSALEDDLDDEVPF